MKTYVWCTARPRVSYTADNWMRGNHPTLDDLNNVPERVSEVLALLQLCAANHPKNLSTAAVSSVGGFWTAMDRHTRDLHLEVYNCSQEELAWFNAQREKR